MLSHKRGLVILSIISLLILLMGFYSFAQQEEYTWPQEWGEPPVASELGINQFSQAPMLESQVENGNLEPVSKRLPEDPMVMVPYEEIGEYGGTVTSAALSPGDWGDGYWGRVSYLFSCNPSTTKVVPSIAKGYEIVDGNKAVLIHLRKGVKWSDGHPFTAEDIMFWYKYEVKDDDITAWWASAPGEKFEKIDDYTVKITFSKPKPRKRIIGLLNHNDTQESFFFDPAHYLKKYHKEFNPDVEELAKKEGFDNWTQLFKYHKTVTPGIQDKDKPTLSPWMLEERSETKKVFVRNPYFWAVDSKGNQLPYIDKWEVRIITDQEVAIMQAMQGNLDFANRLLKPSGFPMYKNNTESGNYEVRRWENTKASKIAYMINRSHPNPVKREMFQNKEFRQALSLAINRKEINDFVYLGTGTPCQATVAPSASYYQKEWAESYASFNPAKARKLLDKVGVTDKDGDGWRESPDGEDFIITLLGQTAADVGSSGNDATQLVASYWEGVGIKTNFKVVARELAYKREEAGTLDVFVFPTQSALELRTYVDMQPYDADKAPPHGYAPAWTDWWEWKHKEESNRSETPKGLKPPEHAREIAKTVEEWQSTLDPEKYKELAKEIWSYQAEYLPRIGVVARTISPTIISNDLHNVPDKIPFTFETLLWSLARPVQWYLD